MDQLPLFDPNDPPKRGHRPRGMLVPLSDLAAHLVARHADLPARVAGRWARYYGLDQSELESDLTHDLNHCAARIPYDPKRNPRHYFYSALHQRIKEIVKHRSLEPDLKAYALEAPRQFHPSVLDELITKEEAEGVDIYADWR